MKLSALTDGFTCVFEDHIHSASEQSQAASCAQTGGYRALPFTECSQGPQPFNDGCGAGAGSLAGADSNARRDGVGASSNASSTGQ